MWEITREFEISVAHHLNNYSGPCQANHGHNIVGEVTLEGDTLDEAGMVIDLKKLSEIINMLIVNVFDHTDLNDVVAFNPTMENLSKYIYQTFEAYLYDYYAITGVRVKEVMLKESSKSKIKYYEPKVDMHSLLFDK